MRKEPHFILKLIDGAIVIIFSNGTYNAAKHAYYYVNENVRLPLRTHTEL